MQTLNPGPLSKEQGKETNHKTERKSFPWTGRPFPSNCVNYKVSKKWLPMSKNYKEDRKNGTATTSRCVCNKSNHCSEGHAPPVMQSVGEVQAHCSCSDAGILSMLKVLDHRGNCFHKSKPTPSTDTLGFPEQWCPTHIHWLTSRYRTV